VCNAKLVHTASAINSFKGPLVIIISAFGPITVTERVKAYRFLTSRDRIPTKAWMSFFCGCCVLSGRGICDGSITRPEETYFV